MYVPAGKPSAGDFHWSAESEYVSLSNSLAYAGRTDSPVTIPTKRALARTEERRCMVSSPNHQRTLHTAKACQALHEELSTTELL